LTYYRYWSTLKYMWRRILYFEDDCCRAAETVRHWVWMPEFTCARLPSGAILSGMGILFLIVGAFIVMGGLQLLGVGLIGLAVVSTVVLSSWAIGKLVFRL
jgi:hypothetical protein